MDQLFRLALCVCLCLGGLQATPVRSARAKPPCTLEVKDVGFTLLSDVSCKNLTLFSPRNDQTTSACHYAALEHYKGQLDAALANCTNTKYIIYSLDALDKCTGPPAAGCNFTLSVHHTFGSFTSALKTFVSNFNTHVRTAE